MARNHGKNKNYKEKTPKEIADVIDDIKSCNMLKDLNKEKIFNDDDGLAYVVADYYVNDLNTNQLRKFFEAIREMEKKKKWEDMESDFYLLKPRMAVSVGRKHIKKPFFDVINAAMNKVKVGTSDEKLENFKVFVEFFEAIVAYHKYLEVIYNV